MRGAREHSVAIAGYLALTVVLTRPLAWHFTTALTGVGDAGHFLWTLWHAKEAVLGREPFFSTRLLYYPQGITLLSHGLGPFLGVVALPFWPLGPEAAYNGAVAVAFVLTGTCMYVLARGLGFEPGVAFFAGVVLLAAPMHLAGAFGHPPKAFLGALPLFLLCLDRALARDRAWWWALGAAGSALLTLLHSADQFVYAALAGAFFTVAQFAAAPRAERSRVARRGARIAVPTLVVCAPMLIAIQWASSRSGVAVEFSRESVGHRPDLLQFVLPYDFGQVLYGTWCKRHLMPIVKAPIETAVFLSWTCIGLCALAWYRGGPAARRWIVFTLACVVLALGPTLAVGGVESFTDYQLPIPMPYAFLTSLPGLRFMRTPGRFMEIGYVGLAVGAAFGLAWAARRWPGRRGSVLVACATALVLLENWPQPFPQTRLRPVPEFYRRLAADDGTYGVLDLPIRPARDTAFAHWHVYYSSFYQLEQMTHRKGIAIGYVSRFYDVHPLFGQFISENFRSDSPRVDDVRVNGQPTSRYANLGFELARLGYRYVVVHKPQPGYEHYEPGAWGEQVARQFVAEVLPGQAPIVDDALVSVFEVPRAVDPSTVTLSIAMMEPAHWEGWEGGVRWLVSPARFLVTSPVAGEAELVLALGPFWDETVPGRGFARGVLTVESGEGVSRVTVPAQPGQTLRVPIRLVRGSQIVMVTLRAGDGSGPDVKCPNEGIDLRTRGDAGTRP